MHVGMLVVIVRQDVVQVEVEDVGVEAADLQVVLKEQEKLGAGLCLESVLRHVTTETDSPGLRFWASV